MNFRTAISLAAILLGSTNAYAIDEAHIWMEVGGHPVESVQAFQARAGSPAVASDETKLPSFWIRNQTSITYAFYWVGKGGQRKSITRDQILFLGDPLKMLSFQGDKLSASATGLMGGAMDSPLLFNIVAKTSDGITIAEDFAFYVKK